MALRALGRQLRSLNLIPVVQPRRFFGASAHHDDEHEEEHGPAQTPTVFDKLVEITVVDMNGVLHKVRGLAGQTLAQALIEYGFPATYFFPNMGFYTQHIPDAHVYVPKDYWGKMPNIDPESEEGGAVKRMFRDIVQDYQRDTSYFASYITLGPELNGMTVGIGPIKPWILHSDWAFAGVHDSKAKQFDKPTVEIWG
ncbi:NADH:ubiquinone oxidoreductase 22 kDa subunit [Volvox carteri f. nagariensis]|uniref:NADH:ubiquinone oxidoreductase 22 kDa subunit n=1 Tax=Volvox carteri f. nagariensis TaxID=3068 RepID=D8TW15_VOLCA|nr:NADH:ubiquinone oxidoreductase 22 kDa subunit [Volvox carteri f. nagariensis]EFJ48290.1 NADH:ubiquinone oxidoreductase 22 kDa subunit [Volvox carteri f. nagariensis]|eukprot:XP_002950544.1 NADH:ubiquinone oxidoreductase 22 kDa subunit [Volvox carteri f. nagariensis]